MRQIQHLFGHDRFCGQSAERVSHRLRCAQFASRLTWLQHTSCLSTESRSLYAMPNQIRMPTREHKYLQEGQVFTRDVIRLACCSLSSSSILLCYLTCLCQLAVFFLMIEVESTKSITGRRKREFPYLFYSTYGLCLSSSLLSSRAQRNELVKTKITRLFIFWTETRPCWLIRSSDAFFLLMTHVMILD